MFCNIRKLIMINKVLQTRPELFFCHVLVLVRAIIYVLPLFLSLYLSLSPWHYLISVLINRKVKDLNIIGDSKRVFRALLNRTKCSIPLEILVSEKFNLAWSFTLEFNVLLCSRLSLCSSFSLSLFPHSPSTFSFKRH